MTPEIVNGLFALGGASLGAVLTGGISIYQSKKNKKRKELTVLTSRVSRLIEVDSSISPVVTITVSGKDVPSVYTFDITLLNSGNETLKNTEVVAEITGDAEILVADIGSANFSYIDTECGAKKESNTKVSVVTSYLNPGDELIAKVLLTEKPDSIKSTFRQPEVKFISRDNYDPTAPDVLTRALFEAIQSNFILHAYMKLVFPSYSRYLDFEKKTKKNT